LVDIQTVSIAIASASVVAGVIYYALQIRHQSHMIQQQNKIRETDLVMRLYSTYGSEDFGRAWSQVRKINYGGYDDFVKKYGAPDSEEPIPWALDKVLYFFEEVGVLLSKKLVDIDMIDQLMGGSIMIIGTKTMPIIEEARKRLNAPRIWRNFEYLYDEMKKREQRQ